MLTPRNLPVGYTIFDWLNVVYAMGQDTTYADGSTRIDTSVVPSVYAPTAWKWTRDQALTPGVTTACIGTPPINALNMQYIVAGDNVSRSTVVMNTDAAYTGSLSSPIISMNKNSGAYTSWINAAPFTTGQFSGFVRTPTIAAVGGTTGPLTLTMMECQEAFLLLWNRMDTAGQTSLGAGAIIDPLSGSAANAESDGRLYSIFTSGQSAFQASTWMSTGNGPFNGSLSSGDSHLYTFNVGAVATTRNTAKIGSFTGATGTFIAPSGDVPNIPLSAYFTTSGQYAGQLRQIGYTKTGASGTEWAVNGASKGYIWGYSTQAVGAAVLLSY